MLQIVIYKKLNFWEEYTPLKHGLILVSCLGISEGDRESNCERAESKTVGGGEKSLQILSPSGVDQNQFKPCLKNMMTSDAQVRTRLYELIAHCIPAEVIFVGIQKELVKVKMNMKT